MTDGNPQMTPESGRVSSATPQPSPWIDLCEQCRTETADQTVVTVNGWVLDVCGYCATRAVDPLARPYLRSVLSSTAETVVPSDSARLSAASHTSSGTRSVRIGVTAMSERAERVDGVDLACDAHADERDGGVCGNGLGALDETGGVAANNSDGFDGPRLAAVCDEDAGGDCLRLGHGLNVYTDCIDSQGGVGCIECGDEPGNHDGLCLDCLEMTTPARTSSQTGCEDRG